jgi:FdhD protein
MPDETTYRGLQYRSGHFSEVEDALAVEESMLISLNGETLTVTMRTPGAEEELVRGLLYTEELYRDAAEPEYVVAARNERGYVTALDIRIPADRILKDFAGSRNIISASSCGLCGRTDFESTLSTNIISESGTIHAALVESMFEKMSAAQVEFRISGGTHAAAAFSLQGELLEIREDIGRHNAVDKVIGGLLRKRKLEQARILTVSGRISYEIVNKARSAGFSFVASVSAPSTMAVDHALEAGMTLMAFCRKDRLTIYAHPERVVSHERVHSNG